MDLRTPIGYRDLTRFFAPLALQATAQAFSHPLVAMVAWIGVSVWVATIYLRHHWIVDVFAGWALAFAAYLAAKHVMKLWRRLGRIAGTQSHSAGDIGTQMLQD